jgi:hypothetical protein
LWLLWSSLSLLSRYAPEASGTTIEHWWYRTTAAYEPRVHAAALQPLIRWNGTGTLPSGICNCVAALERDVLVAYGFFLHSVGRMHPHCPVKRACFQRLRKRPLRLCRHLEVPAAIDQHHRALNCSSRRSSVTIDPALTLSSLHPCTIQMEICIGRSVPGYRFFYRYLFCMFSRHILKSFISGFRFICAFRILGRVLGMAPSTLCRWNLLRHGNQEDSLRSAWKAQRSHP